MAEQKVGAAGELVQTSKCLCQTLAAENERRLGIGAHRREGVNAAVFPADFEVQRDAGGSEIPARVRGGEVPTLAPESDGSPAPRPATSRTFIESGRLFPGLGTADDCGEARPLSRLLRRRRRRRWRLGRGRGFGRPATYRLGSGASPRRRRYRFFGHVPSPRRSQVVPDRNSTISTSLPGIRMAATPSAGIRLSSTSHSPSEILKWPSSGWRGHSSGHP